MKSFFKINYYLYRAASSILQNPLTTVHSISRNCLFFVSLYGSKSSGIEYKWRTKTVKFCWFAKSCSTQPQGCSEFLPKLVFSNECVFRFNRVVNLQNVRSWGFDRRNKRNLVVIDKPCGMTCCVILKDCRISPYFSSMETLQVRASEYANFHAFPFFSDCCEKAIYFRKTVPLNTFPPELRLIWTTSFLTTRLRVTISYLASTPDLILCDFSLWGFIKSKMCSSSIRSIEELENRMRAEIRRVSPDSLTDIWDYTILWLII